MKERLKKGKELFEAIIKSFNFAFFVVSLMLWIYFTVLNILTKPFEFGLLWDGFNTMYGEFSFKVSCIFLILFNGMNTIRGYFLQYYDLKENFGHAKTLKEVAHTTKK